MLPWSAELAGRFEQPTYDSAVLRGNPLGDPYERPVLVYLPPGYDESEQRYPSIYVAMGYTGHLGMWFNRSPFRQPYPELLDAMFATGDVPPAIVVFVDGWTRFGGSQYLEMYGYASAYSALPDGTVQLPFNELGVVIPEVWERWLANDPVEMAAQSPYREALQSMRAIWIDAGKQDEYYLDLGATAFRDAVRAVGVPDERVHFELFEGTHAGIEYRYPLAVAWLCQQLS